MDRAIWLFHWKYTIYSLKVIYLVVFLRTVDICKPTGRGGGVNKMSKDRVCRSCREGALQLHHPFLCCDQPDILAFINISPASQCMNDAIILLLQPVCTRVTECLGPVSHLQTCSARFPDDYLCSAPRPNTKWQLLRYNDACRRRNVSTLRYSAAFFVGQLVLPWNPT